MHQLASASTRTSSFHEPRSLLHQDKRCQDASCPTLPCCPEMLIICFERCFQRMVLRARSMAAAPCQMQGGGGQKRQEARLWLLQTQLSQMEWMCSQVATVSSVYTICSCRSCWFCHFSAQRTRLSSRKTEKRSCPRATVLCSCSSTRLAFFPD